MEETTTYQNRLHKLARQLQLERAILAAREHQARNDLPATNEPLDIGDYGKIYEDAEEHSRNQLLRSSRIQAIDQALHRMARGVYGICQACNKPITLERLEAMPLACYCIECQAKKEQSHKTRRLARSYLWIFPN